MCRNFHADINDLKLLCTYAGLGILWVTEGKNSRVCNEKEPFDEGQIQQANTGYVLILKGALYPENNPIAHRSSTIQETGEKHLFKRLF